MTRFKTLVFVLLCCMLTIVLCGCRANSDDSSDNRLNDIIDSITGGNDDKTSTNSETYLQTGVGYTVDAVSAKNYNDYKKGVSVLDRSKLSKASFDKNMVQYNSVKTYSTNSISDLITKSTLTHDLKMDIGGKASGITAGIEFGLTSSASFEYKKYSDKYYSVLDHYIERYSLSLVNYAMRGQYADYLSREYVSSIAYLYENQTDTEFFKFFSTYGTHLIGSAVFGGRLNTYFSTVTNKVTINEDKVTELSRGLKFGADGVDLSAKATDTVKSILGDEATDTEISFSAVAYGGNAFGANSIDDFKDNYKTWWDSFNEDSANAVLISYSDDGLIPLWEMLPEEYQSMSDDMQAAFIKYYKDSYNRIIDTFRFSNTADYDGGDGTQDAPFIISTAEHLANIDLNMDSYFKLKNDIDLSSYADWVALGGHYREKAFNGTLDGDGHTLAGMKRTSVIGERDSRIYFGLFGYVGSKGVVKNLNFENVNVNVHGPEVNNENTRVYFGVVAGTLYGTVENVKVLSGSFAYDTDTNGNAHVGGIAGYAYSAKISNCENHIPLVSRRYAATVGGMVGEGASVKFRDCTNFGNLHGYHYIGGYCYAGGMIGQDVKSYESSYLRCGNEGELKVSGYNGAYNSICPTGVGEFRGGVFKGGLPEQEH